MPQEGSSVEHSCNGKTNLADPCPASIGSAKAEGHASDCLGVVRRGRPCRRASAGSWPVLQRRAKGAHPCPWPCSRASALCSRQFSCPCFRSGRRRPRRQRPSWSFVGVAQPGNRNARPVALVEEQQRRREDGGILVLAKTFSELPIQRYACRASTPRQPTDLALFVRGPRPRGQASRRNSRRSAHSSPTRVRGCARCALAARCRLEPPNDSVCKRLVPPPSRTVLGAAARSSSHCL